MSWPPEPPPAFAKADWDRPPAGSRSAEEALLLQRALDEQRERIAAGVAGWANCICGDQPEVHAEGCPWALCQLLSAEIRRDDFGQPQRTEGGRISPAALGMEPMFEESVDVPHIRTED